MINRHANVWDIYDGGNAGMPQFIIDLFSNQLLMCGLVSWAVGQILKTIINAIVTKKWDFMRLIGDGGMPSCHSATVTSMAVFSALMYGVSSNQFAIMAIVAIIVMHDAMGVRLETGKQAKVLNEMMEIFTIDTENLFSEEKLKEFVGHTPLQVFFGALLGVVVALIFFEVLTH